MKRSRSYTEGVKGNKVKTKKKDSLNYKTERTEH